MARVWRTARVREISERAQELIAKRSATAWNRWRRQYNLFGDHVDARIDLIRADIRDRDLRSYVLTNVDFSNAILENANLEGCDCTSGSFHLSNLVGANLKGASLRGANLSRAYLRGAQLHEADLRLADLRRASLTGAYLTDADLRGVDLRSTRGVSQEQLEEAIGDINTLLPPHLERPGHWTKYARPPIAPDSLEDGDENIPAPLPATVEVSIDMGRMALAADAGDALFTSSFNEEELRQNIIEDLTSVLPRLSNTGELARSANRYLDALSKPALGIIILGMRGEQFGSHIKKHAETSNKEDSLLPDVLGALNGILIQHYLLVNQSHKWRAFFEEASRSKFEINDVSRAQKHADSLVEILRTHPEACDEEVSTAIEGAVAEAKLWSSPAKLSVFNIYAGINNILRTLASWGIKEFRRGGSKAWSSFRESLATQLGSAGAALIIATSNWFAINKLAEKWPEYFGWFKFFIGLLK